MLRSGSLISRCSAFGLLLFFIAAGFQFVIQPLVNSYRDNHAKIRNLTSILLKQERLTGSIQSISDELNSAERPVLQHASDTLAKAALQDQISSIVAKHGGDVRSVRILPSVDVADGPAFQKNIVGIQFTADIAALARALSEFEVAEPVLFVERLQVVSVDSRTRDIEGLDASELDVRIDVFTFVRR